MENKTQIIPDLVLLGLIEMEGFKYLYFVITLVIYVSILVLCLMIVAIIWNEPSLHEPMYSFICNLIVNGMFGSAAFYPKLMIDLLSGYTTISLGGCLVQAFCLQTYACLDIFTFTIIAYDRYLAVCFPLRYPTLMTNRKTLKWIAVAWGFLFVDQTVFVVWTSSLGLCGATINNVYCETMSLMKLSCRNSSLINILGSFMTILMVVSSLLVVVYCYIRTFVICLKISREACQKAIHTLVTHLLAFSTFMAATLFVGFRYRLNIGGVSSNFHLVIAVTGLAVSTTLNPLIYGLRTEVLRKRIIKKMHMCSKLGKPD
ncbi:olfactory receptor 6Y1-like [Spea bombifrons]|uniref:olfactory receptor 6Y1-like n=1 Tax=Spea bombifrons TaxID=233779 RepID=UPI00234AF8AE|nr:olfactory receptor 6Y1-like [Spea bombifrons]